jgi:ribosomal protein L37AE/L43A
MRYPSAEHLPGLLRSLIAPTRGGKCAQCGVDIIAPEWSEHLAERRVRNVWSCDLCGYQFEDTVYLSGAPSGAEQARRRHRAGGVTCFAATGGDRLPQRISQAIHSAFICGALIRL